MGRHADRTAERPRLARIRVSVPVVAICLLLIGAVVLGIWWWKLKSVTDPIAANPVDAYAVVVDSPACTAGGSTTVLISGTDPAVTARLSGCGYAKDQRLAVQYLAGDPEQVRLSGSSTAGSAGMAARLLPIGILAAGLVAVLATVALLVERRRSRHRSRESKVTVADLRTRASQAASESQGQDAPTAAAGSDHRAAGPDHRAAGPDHRAAGPAAAGETASSGGDRSIGDGDPAGGHSRFAGSEPAHVLPSGFVMVDEQLFTHSGPEADSGSDQPAI